VSDDRRAPDDDAEILVHSADEAQVWISRGAVLLRHAHQMSALLPAPVRDEPEFHPFASGGVPAVPWTDVLHAFLAAYPPDHPDHLAGGSALIDDYLIPYAQRARLGPLIEDASAIAVRDGFAYGGVLIVDRPGEGPWVCDLWRDPRPEYAGAGARLLAWAMGRLIGHERISLVVTVGNDRALRAYERLGFTIESTAWRLRAP
jgi:ribosomal protein S18 acetylase RimI-like enzyme